VAVTQLVDKPNLGVHVRLPKTLFTSARAPAKASTK
jgi:acetamidase/formamidase